MSDQRDLLEENQELRERVAALESQNGDRRAVEGRSKSSKGPAVERRKAAD